MYIAATSAPVASELTVEWGRAQDGRVTRLASSGLVTGLDGEDAHVTRWRFVRIELPAAAEDAAALRIRLAVDTPPGAAVAATPPLTFEHEQLTPRFAASRQPSLILPNLLTYFPCARLPRIEDGLVEVPGAVLGFQHVWPLGNGTTPFEGVLDLYRLDRLPVYASSTAATEAGMYEVDPRISGAAVAAPKVSR